MGLISFLEIVYVAFNASLDGGTKIALILDTVATKDNQKILGVVDLLLLTVNGSVKREVFKYELVLKNELDESKPMPKPMHDAVEKQILTDKEEVKEGKISGDCHPSSSTTSQISSYIRSNWYV